MKKRRGPQSSRHEPTVLPDWVLPQQEIRQRLAVLLKNWKVNGWSAVAIAEAADMGEYGSNFCQSLAYYGNFMGIGPQIRLSRVLRLIDSGLLAPRKVFTGKVGRPKIEAHLLANPPPPKIRTQVTVGISRTGPKLRVRRSRDYSFDELLTARVPRYGRTSTT